jgi:16S rRNA (cytosine1402-N4)-methyltransferase
MTNDEYHIPVLLRAAVDGLVQNSNGIYVDVTFGGGGHSKEILSRLKNGKLIGFDQDLDAEQNSIEDDRFVFVAQNFEFLKNNLRMLRQTPVDGVLADLGVSSYQFNTPDRGFSYRFDGKLDMRMNANSTIDAEKIINQYEEEDLVRIFKDYGELRESKRLARRIVDRRQIGRIQTINDLLEIVSGLVQRNKTNQFLSKIFQAIRIEVNEEIEVLKKLLEQGMEVIKPGGRFVIITYHSLEDRLVKNFFRSGNFKGVLEKDFYGNVLKPFNEINRKPIIPDENELKSNNRARSAKLRIAERLE